MANNPHLAVATRNAMLDRLNTDLNNGGAPFFTIYAGVQPADCSAAVTAANVALATLNMSATAFAAASAGSMTANAISSAIGLVAGTATWFSAQDSLGMTRRMEGSIGTSGANMNLSSVTIVTNMNVKVSAFVVTSAA